jgi:hypothetical protein
VEGGGSASQSLRGASHTAPTVTTLAIASHYPFLRIGSGLRRRYAEWLRELFPRSAMNNVIALRAPEPFPPPVKEPPPDSPGNPDVPVREPDPVEPSQI